MTPFAVISGGATGIGRGVAARLLAGGWDVLLVGRRAEVLADAASALGAGVEWHAADVADPSDVDDLVRWLDGRTVDAVVANAGATQPKAGPSVGEVLASWEAALRSNLLTAVGLVAGFEQQLARPGGRIVLIGSKAARTGGASPAYVAAKAGLEGWVRHLAGRLGPEGITANVVVPGLIDGTDLVAGRLSDERRSRIVAATAAGRTGTPEDIAGAVAYLASPAAAFVNGQVLAVDGGDVPPS